MPEGDEAFFSQIQRNPLQLDELVGMVVARHRRVRDGRAQVLADRENPAADLTEIPERRHELVMLPAHAQDSQGTAHALSDGSVDWLVVDHYALDARWEAELRSAAGRLLVIDDLADRRHDCDVLLDATTFASAAWISTG